MNRSVRRVAFRVEYDGTDFHGWQRQPSGCPTIQGAIEDALKALFDREHTVQGASRTDAGVHAIDQLAAVSIDHPMRLEGFVKGLNRRLPESIAIRDAEEVTPDFNPRFQNDNKTYRYQVYTCRERRPLIDRYAWRIPWPVEIAPMQRAADLLCGSHDFTSFAASDGGHKTAERTLLSFGIQSGASQSLQFTVTGTAFLKQMVRNLVGTLIEVGRGRIAPETITAILAAKNRSAAGPTAPARGLTLMTVNRSRS